jgi:hypothetical protein
MPQDLSLGFRALEAAFPAAGLAFLLTGKGGDLLSMPSCFFFQKSHHKFLQNKIICFLFFHYYYSVLTLILILTRIGLLLIAICI